MTVKLQRIRKLRPTFVSLLGKGANLVPGLLKGEDDGVEIVCLTKAEPKKGLLHSIVYSPDLPDAHGHYMAKEDIEEAAHAHARNGLNLDLKHDLKALGKDQAHVVENMVLTKTDDRFPTEDRLGRTIKHNGAWAQIIKIEDPGLLALAEAGELTEVSLYAPAGNFELVDEPSAVSKTEPDTSMDLEKFLEGMSALLKTQTEAIQASNQDLVKSLAKSEDGGERGDGSGDAPPPAFTAAGFPILKAEDACNPHKVAEYERAIISKALDDETARCDGDLQKTLKIAQYRSKLAKKWAEEDSSAGLTADSTSILKGLLPDFDEISAPNHEGDSDEAMAKGELDDDMTTFLNQLNADNFAEVGMSAPKEVV